MAARTGTDNRDIGEQIRARIGADVLDQMLDDLVEGLAAMARAEAERPACVRVSRSGVEQCRSAREESDR